MAPARDRLCSKFHLGLHFQRRSLCPISNLYVFSLVAETKLSICAGIVPERTMSCKQGTHQFLLHILPPFYQRTVFEPKKITHTGDLVRIIYNFIFVTCFSHIFLIIPLEKTRVNLKLYTALDIQKTTHG